MIGDFLIKPATYLNLLLVIVLVVFFIRMFLREAHEKVYKTPWVLLFIGVMIFIVEEVMTVLRHAGIISYPHLVVNGFFEMGIITLFIYMLLLQKEHIKQKGF